MKYLSLFSGVGGGDLACQHLLGWRCVGYVEWEKYCQKVIAARIRDRMLDPAPIYGDIREFNFQGYAEAYQGMVDVISGGFPCQPFSNAGKRRGADDPRNMWPATIECIRTIRPQYALLENVAALLSSGYFGTILGDLAESGYDARWRILSAAELGAPHQRDRIWIVCNPSSQRTIRNNSSEGRGVGLDLEQNSLRQARRNQGKHQPLSSNKANVANADSEWEPQPQGTQQKKRRWAGNICEKVRNPTEQRLPNGTKITMGESRVQPKFERSDWWKVEPDVGRVANGVAYRVDRLRAIGNGQVSAVAAKAWDLLTSEKRP